MQNLPLSEEWRFEMTKILLVELHIYAFPCQEGMNFAVTIKFDLKLTKIDFYKDEFEVSNFNKDK